HEAGEHDGVDAGEHVDEPGLEFHARDAAMIDDLGAHARRARPLERTRTGIVRHDDLDRDARIDQRLQVRALARHEHAELHTNRDGSPPARVTIRPTTRAPGICKPAGPTTIMPRPMLNVRRISSSSTPALAINFMIAGTSHVL